MNFTKFKDKFSLLVTEEFNKVRIDKFISTQIEELSRSKIKNLIDNGYVKSSFNKNICKGDYKISPNEEITIYIPKIKPSELKGEVIDFQVVYEDKDLAVIDKPAGLTVHPGTGTQNDTLVHGLINKFGSNLSNICGDERPGIIHRLDRNTSGLMVIAKNNATHLKLAKMIELKEINRFYLALILGLPKPCEGKIAKNIARAKRDRKKMGVVAIGGKSATTHYKVIEVFKNSLASLVECQLETGRTHQIRVHFSHLGHPVLGDPEYGNFRSYRLHSLGEEVKNYLTELNRQALHSYKLEFLHPITGQKLHFQSNLPDDINILINLLKK